MTKRRDVIRKITKAARARGVEIETREGGNHSVIYLDGLRVPIPRHVEIPERTTRGIYRECATKLGKDLVATMTTYHARVSRDGRGWHIYVPEIDRVTAARNLGEAEIMARDLIVCMTDVAPDSFDLDVEIELPADVREHLTRARELNEQSERLRADAAELRATAARELHDTGASLRDVGAALGVSYQRAHQLVTR